MAREIDIKRADNTVTFQEVSIAVGDTVFFRNLDTDTSADPLDPQKARPKGTHWPTRSDGKLFSDSQLPPGDSQSTNCIVPKGTPDVLEAQKFDRVDYGCKFHSNESGKINVYPKLVLVPPGDLKLPAGKKSQPLAEQQLVKGGKGEYTVTDQEFQVTRDGTVVDKGSGPGPGLELIQKGSADLVWGLWVKGTPTEVGTYVFTFTVVDKIGQNRQNDQYSMEVTDK